MNVTVDICEDKTLLHKSIPYPKLDSMEKSY